MTSHFRLAVACLGLLVAACSLGAEEPAARPRPTILGSWSIGRPTGGNIPSKQRPTGHCAAGRHHRYGASDGQAARPLSACPRWISRSSNGSNATASSGSRSRTWGPTPHRIAAHLYLPKSRPAGQRVAAMLALHQTSAGKERSLRRRGGAGQSGLRQGAGRARLCRPRPDYPSFGDYAVDFHKSRFASGSMMGVFNHMRGVDLLQAHEEVDPARIGVIGHSLGGHNAMLVGAFDQRLKVIVSSCGSTHSTITTAASWPAGSRIATCRGSATCTEWIPTACRSTFTRSWRHRAATFFPTRRRGDYNFDVAGVKKADGERAIYALLGADDRLQIVYPDCSHDFPPAIRRQAYAFIDRILGHTPSRKVPE